MAKLSRIRHQVYRDGAIITTYTRGARGSRRVYASIKDHKRGVRELLADPEVREHLGLGPSKF